MTAADAPDRDDAALAAEFALHLLDAGERVAFERRLAVEPALQELVRDWDENFAALADQVAPVTPPRKLKKAITARVFGQATQADPPLWLRWRLGIGGFALAALVGLAVLFGNLFPGGPTGPVMHAEIAAPDRSMLVMASLDLNAGTLQVEHMAGSPPEGRVLELWLIAKDATAPVSLGVFADTGTTSMQVPEVLLAKFAEGTLAISDEPPGGSPTGAPTGSVMATGAVTLL